jgi:hypothetical protein
MSILATFEGDPKPGQRTSYTIYGVTHGRHGYLSNQSLKFSLPISLTLRPAICSNSASHVAILS